MIFCPENKDVVLFPEKIDGQYVALHRPNAATPFCRPEMWLARSPRLDSLGAARMPARRRRRVGDGPRRRRHASGSRCGRLARNLPRQPPADATWRGGHVFHRACCCWMIRPGENLATKFPFDLRADQRTSSDTGFVPDVVFPTGIVEIGESYLMYYGAADCCTAVVEFAQGRCLRIGAGNPRTP